MLLGRPHNTGDGTICQRSWSNAPSRSPMTGWTGWTTTHASLCNSSAEFQCCTWQPQDARRSRPEDLRSNAEYSKDVFDKKEVRSPNSEPLRTMSYHAHPRRPPHHLPHPLATLIHSTGLDRATKCTGKLTGTRVTKRERGQGQVTFIIVECHEYRTTVFRNTRVGQDVL